MLWPITSISQFGPGPLLVEPDMTGRTGDFRPSLLDHLVSGGQQRLGDSEAEGVGSRHVDAPLAQIGRAIRWPQRLGSRATDAGENSITDLCKYCIAAPPHSPFLYVIQVLI